MSSMDKTQEAAHTQGPWEACGQYVRTARAADGSGGFLVAELPVNEPGMAERARLIAAAPELLEALTMITDRAEEWINMNLADEVGDKARAAIAKATGSDA